MSLYQDASLLMMCDFAVFDLLKSRVLLDHLALYQLEALREELITEDELLWVEVLDDQAEEE